MDWAGLHHDVLSQIFGLLPQADILRGAGLACAAWRRLAVNEPLLWRHIDLAADEDKDEDAPAGWYDMVRAAVSRSAGRCESFRGRVDSYLLIYIADNAPSLRSLHVTSRFDIMVDRGLVRSLMKAVPLLEQLVLSSGRIEKTTLTALVDSRPRLELLDAAGCYTLYIDPHIPAII